MPNRWHILALGILTVLAVVLLIPFAAEPGTLGDAAVIAAASADLVSTHVAMQRGGREVNTVSSLKGQAALHLLVAGGSIALARQADKGGHRGWARAARIVPIVIFGGAATWNLARGGR